MADQLVSCPSCKTAIQLDSDKQRPLEIACPSCGKSLRIRERPQPPEVEEVVQPLHASSESQPASPHLTSPSDQDDTMRAKTILVIGLLAGGIGLVFLIGAVVLVTVTFMGKQKVGQENPLIPPQIAANDVLRPADSVTATAQPDRSPKDSITPPADSVSSVADPPQGNAPAGFRPDAPTGTAKPALLKYGWQPGTTHVYEIQIKAEIVDTIQRTDGTCTYHVFEHKPSGGMAEPDQEGYGTGFVVAADGHLMTCAHVVKDAKQIEVSLGIVNFRREWLLSIRNGISPFFRSTNRI